MSATGEHKIKVSVGLTPRMVTEITKEATRLGISFADVTRRIMDAWTDAREKATTPEKILVLDRDAGKLRGVR